jgi:hypothetical protein
MPTQPNSERSAISAELEGRDRDVRVKRVYLLVLLLPLVFHTFMYFPGFSPIQEGWNLLCLLYLVFVYPWGSAKPGKSITTFDLYMIALIVVDPVVSAVNAWREFGQPIIYGLLAERRIALIACVLFIARALRMRSITLREVERALLILAWGTMILFRIMRTVIDPSNYVDYYGFALPVMDGFDLSLPVEFALFGVLYYAFRGFRTGRARDYMLALLLLGGSLSGFGWRQQVLTLLLTFFFFVCRWTNWRRLLVLLPQMLLGLALLVGLLFATMPKTMTEQFGRLQDAFTVVLTGESVEDSAANERIEETLFALEGIAKHPIIGNGILSNQWQGGVPFRQGKYFPWMDVGTIGVLYILGIFGVILYASQYWFVLGAVKKLPPGVHTPLMDATKGFVFYSAVISLTGAFCVAGAVISLFFIALLRGFANEVSFFESARSVAGSIQSESWY